MNKVFSFICALLMLVSLTFSVAQASTSYHDYVVAMVEQSPITHQDVMQNMTRFKSLIEQHNILIEDENQMYKQTLDFLVMERVQLNLAKQNSIEFSKTVVDEEIARIAEQSNMSLDELKQSVAHDGMSWKRYKDNVHNQLVFMQLRKIGALNKENIGRQDIAEYLRQQEQGDDIENFDIELGQILINIPGNATEQEIEQLQQRAQEALNELKNKKSFRQVAEKYSDKKDSFTLSFRSAKSYPSLFIDQVRHLPKNGISGVFRSPAGFNILKVIDKVRIGSPAALIFKSKVRHIILTPTEKINDDQVIAQLKSIRQSIQAGQMSFSVAAKNYSKDASAAYGGDLGWIAPGAMVPEFEQAVQNLPVGILSMPIATRFGFHLVEVTDRRQERLSGAERDEMVKNILIQKNQNEEFQDWLREVRANTYVEYRLKK